jgi:hypothetical protein
MTDEYEEQWRDIRDEPEQVKREFIQWDEQNQIEGTFESNDFRTGESKFKDNKGNPKKQYYLDITDFKGVPKVLGASNRMMDRLKAHLPLKNKRLNIEKTGVDFDIEYVITLIE